MPAVAAYRDFITPAAQSFGNDGVGSCAIEHHQRSYGCRPLGLLKDVSHAAQVAFAFFTHVADKKNRSGIR